MMLETMLVGILQAGILGLVEIPQLGLELLEREMCLWAISKYFGD
jgi:hypothetical protein